MQGKKTAKTHHRRDESNCGKIKTKVLRTRESQLEFNSQDSAQKSEREKFKLCIYVRKEKLHFFTLDFIGMQKKQL